MNIPSKWLDSPVESFKEFIGSEDYMRMCKKPGVLDEEGSPRYLLGVDTQKIYINMFGRFFTWMVANHTNLGNIRMEDLQRFIDEPREGRTRLSSTIRLRYLRMLERVFEHLQIVPNTAKLLAKQIDKSQVGRDKPLTYLTSNQRQALVDVLADQNAIDTLPWKRIRDRAMIALMIGAGMKVSEVVSMECDAVGDIDIKGDLRITVEPMLMNYKHDTFLEEDTVPILLRWIDERTKLDIPGNVLFPPSIAGESASGKRTLDHATVYLQVKATLSAADIHVDHKGGRTLRNTFAVLSLLNGKSVQEVKEYLGHAADESINIYLLKAKELARR